MIKIAVLVLGCCLFFSCKKNTIDIDIPVKNDPNSLAVCPTPTAVNIQVGYLQTQQIFLCDNQPLTVTFTHVIEDSRCPLGVDCPWMGRAVAGFTFNFSAAEFQIEPGETIQFNWNGYTINAIFTELNPYPVYGAPYDINNYVAAIAFSSP